MREDEIVEICYNEDGHIEWEAFVPQYEECGGFWQAVEGIRQTAKDLDPSLAHVKVGELCIEVNPGNGGHKTLFFLVKDGDARCCNWQRDDLLPLPYTFVAGLWCMACKIHQITCEIDKYFMRPAGVNAERED